MNRVMKWVIGMGILSIVTGLLLLLFTFAPGRWMMGNGFFMGDRDDVGMMHGNGGMGRGNSIDLVSSIEPAKPLPIPERLRPDRVTEDELYYTVRAQIGDSQFLSAGAQTETLGYNGDLLGPMIELPKGKTVYINTINQLNDPTSFHWHGLVIPGKQDGGPHQLINPGEQHQVRLDIDQEPGTLWFHPHPMGDTAEQVYRGLAGLLYVTDESAETDIPNEYGVDDIPLIVQDRLFTDDGRLDYDRQMNIDGTVGDTLLANGAINATFDVTTNTLRVRLVNGSNARNLDFSLSNGEPFTQIATDGGLLDKPVSLKTLTLTPSERAEILIDFSDLSLGDDIALQADGIPFTTFTVRDRIDQDGEWIDAFEGASVSNDSSVADRRLTLFGMGNMVTIDGKQFDPGRIDIDVQQGTTEVWEIYNRKDMMGGMTHPFHVHGVQFRILERDGNPPPDNERGWKDTVAVAPGEKVKIEMTFKETGTFMYHCHILEHEENGMMGQLRVNK
ncbi:copper oxidase [Exiguobacterium sp. SH3S2]|uniref:multicopper oxidase family protein n=1 Tax=unclassified Exiguobacterium TaxID=2644629 RepID=UPI001038FE5A|nr:MULTISPECIES: multicopper oxidase domain-containing protein [unclassified Exiguobacterium]TCI42169.1 copper oxidase [Exiguobacterium sp. SH3S3]TCI58245.1 copper oxidase [Exiguobacterium sp. SH3S2]